MNYFANLNILDNAGLAKAAPSIFATEPQPGCSDRYQFASTINVIDMMRENGYEPISAAQTAVRGAGPQDPQYARHLVKMVHRDYLSKTRDQRQVGDVVPQVLLSNSHNRTSAFGLNAGLFRLTCANGMAVEAGTLTAYRVLHNDKSLHDNIIEGTRLIRQVTQEYVFPAIEKMQGIELDEGSTREFALAATMLKYGEPVEEEVDSFLHTRRDTDEGRSLWSVLNRCQENAVKAGYASTNRAGHNITRKPITSVTRDLDFNLRLWSLGAKVLAVA